MNLAIVNADTVTCFDVNHYVTEASTLGLAPNDWPRLLSTDLGNGQFFMIAKVNESEDGTGVDSVEYKQAYGCISLKVFND